MSDESMRTVLVSLGAGLGVSLAKVVAAVLTGSAAMAAEAAHSLADNANDLSLFVAQRRSSRPPDDQHPLGYGREAYFWALLAAPGVLVVGVAFSLRDGIDELVHPSATQSFAVAYVVLAARVDIDDDLRGAQVTSLVRGIVSGLEHGAEAVYRVDVVPIGAERSAASTHSSAGASPRRAG